MRFATIFVSVMLYIPFLGLFLYMALNPRDTALWGKRWQFKNEDLEPSDEAIKYNRNASILMLIVGTITLIGIIIRS